MSLAFTNARIFTGTETIEGKVLIVRGNKIDSITAPFSIPTECEIIDCGGNYLSAGFIDLQIRRRISFPPIRHLKLWLPYHSPYGNNRFLTRSRLIDGNFRQVTRLRLRIRIRHFGQP